MPKLFLKDSKSKDIIQNWLIAGMSKYSYSSWSYWADEDSLCGHFFSSISGSCNFDSGEFRISNLKLRGRGPSAPEKKIGADGIGILDLVFPDISLKGFFLYQAKKTEDNRGALVNAKEECDVMLTHTPASYLLVLLPAEIKMVGAMAVSANLKKSPNLNNLPFVNYPRFVVEHMLHGIMLESYDKLRPALSADIYGEIKNVSIAVGGSKEMVNQAIAAIQQDVLSMNWEAYNDNGKDGDEDEGNDGEEDKLER
jgi:hypothetical protein